MCLVSAVTMGVGGINLLEMVEGPGLATNHAMVEAVQGSYLTLMSWLWEHLMMILMTFESV